MGNSSRPTNPINDMNGTLPHIYGENYQQCYATPATCFIKLQKQKSLICTIRFGTVTNGYILDHWSSVRASDEANWKKDRIWRWWGIQHPRHIQKIQWDISAKLALFPTSGHYDNIEGGSKPLLTSWDVT